jgi:hypothetical protein
VPTRGAHSDCACRVQRGWIFGPTNAMLRQGSLAPPKCRGLAKLSSLPRIYCISPPPPPTSQLLNCYTVYLAKASEFESIYSTSCLARLEQPTFIGKMRSSTAICSPQQNGRNCSTQERLLEIVDSLTDRETSLIFQLLHQDLLHDAPGTIMCKVSEP